MHDPSAVRDPAAPIRWDARYDQGDHLHPHNAGMEVLATAISLDLLA
ncbi:hypothetical protein M1L60_33275 [Actinoplanes sp. TRM 88003]|uniref:Uncharacterized protein n=1 Tax=Paractinoplanes aksuensis TaxID=2939490 RepID=A0ABT1DZL0_9ACTN|nr:hypothetical protein [Actinoplanes aksuensis]MCO8275466.1 hypothetical protein [Actinoplanes aksuensis]